MKKIKSMSCLILAIVFVFGIIIIPTNVATASETTVPMYRLYNPNSGEHFYTGSYEEKSILVNAGWNYEGVAWNSPRVGEPVYRVYNPNSGDHHYTVAQAEVDMLVNAGWIYEGVAWNTADDSGVPQFRMWNPNADLGSHHYTSSEEERDFLISVGWICEGIGWYGASNHKYVVVEINPTCESDGYVSKYCRICGYVYEYTKLNALGHNYGLYSTIDSSCTDNGKEIFKCTRCNNEYERIIEALGHNYIDGKCNVCGEKTAELIYQEKINNYNEYKAIIDRKISEIKAEGDVYYGSDSYFNSKIDKLNSEISTKERKLSALANDPSMSAAAQRAKLKAEINELEAEKNELYASKTRANKIDALENELKKYHKSLFGY